MTARVRLSRRAVLVAVGVSGFCLAVGLAAADWWVLAVAAGCLPWCAVSHWSGYTAGLADGADEREQLRTQVDRLEDERNSGYATWGATTRRWADDTRLRADTRTDWAAADANTPARSRAASST